MYWPEKLKIYDTQVISVFSPIYCSMIQATNEEHQPKKLQPDRYLGTWFELYRTQNIPFEKGTNILANYGPKTTDSVTVNNYQFMPDKNKWDAIHGDAIIEDLNMPARLGVKFFFFQPRGNYTVLYTDYNQVSVVFSHQRFLFGLCEIRYGWILSRTKTLPPDVIDKAFSILEAKAGLTRDAFIKTEHQQGFLPPELEKKQ